MKNAKTACIALLVVVCLITLFIRIPLPSRGYFNVGDIAVVFSGLVLGFLVPGRGWLWAIVAGGVGSALADILGGFAMFAPLTFVAKSLEAGFAALAVSRSGFGHYLFLGLGGLGMVGGYFIGEVMMPNIGFQGAAAELLPNIIQAVGGAVGGRLTFAAYQRVMK